MKKTLTMAILAVAAVAVLALAPTAYATEKTIPKPPPRSETAPSTSEAAALAAANAAAEAKAAAGATAGSTAAVGPVISANELTSEQVANLRNQSRTDVDMGDTNVEGSTSRSYGLAVSLPQLANAGDIAASGCPDASTTKGARGVLMGVYSSSSAEQTTDKCTLRMLAAQASQDCQNLEARAYRLAAAKKAAGGDIDIGTTEAKNLTLQECIDQRLRAAGKVVTTNVNNFNRFELNQPPAPPAAVIPPPAPPKKVIKRAPPCPTGEKLVCKPTKP